KQDEAVGQGVTGLALADINGDGRADLVATSYFNNQVTVLLSGLPGGGRPEFVAGRAFATSVPYWVAQADVNGDGRLDLITATQNNSRVSIFLGNGDGTFGDETHFTAGMGPRAVAVADVSGDGKP